MRKRTRIQIWSFVLGLALVLLAGAAHADCTDPTEIEGAIVYNADQNVPQVCIGSTWIALGALNPSAGGGSCTNPADTEGAIVYNSDYNLVQYCDGENWRAVVASGDGGCTAPSLCPNVGDTCTDGSIFAGFMLYGTSCEALFVTDTIQSTGSAWSTEQIDTGADDWLDGQVNQQWIVTNETLSEYPAFEVCETLDRHSHQDWYLPSREETYLLRRNAASLNFGGNNFHYTSTEADAGKAMGQNFTGMHGGEVGKLNTHNVRCIRRD